MCKRCAWVTDDPVYQAYHDKEWGVPVYDSQILFEFLILESFQAGLSWLTVLRKREAFRRAFDGFDPKLMAAYDEAKLSALMLDASIIRNRLKINAAVVNARAFLELETQQTFSDYCWSFVGGAPIINHWQSLCDVPATTGISDTLSNDLKKRGFRFVGSTTIYAYMQATGMVMDHTTDCFRYAELSG